MSMLSRDDLPVFYSEDWQRWQDPQCPEYVEPTNRLLDRHAAGALADKPALICDDRLLSYRELLQETCRFSGGLTATGCARESRILFFATDSVEYVACWLGAVRSGIVPKRNGAFWVQGARPHGIRRYAAAHATDENRPPGASRRNQKAAGPVICPTGRSKPAGRSLWKVPGRGWVGPAPTLRHRKPILFAVLSPGRNASFVALDICPLQQARPNVHL